VGDYLRGSREEKGNLPSACITRRVPSDRETRQDSRGEQEEEKQGLFPLKGVNGGREGQAVGRRREKSAILWAQDERRDARDHTGRNHVPEGSWGK